MPGQRDALLNLLRGQDVGQVVWTADIDYWITGRESAGKADPAWRTEEGYLQLCTELRIMPYYWYGKFWLAEPEYDGTVELRTEKRGSVTRRTWTTPVGELREEVSFVRESSSAAHTRYPVSTREDLDVFRYILEHRRLRPAGMEEYPQRLELWARYDGIPSIALPRSPLPAFFYEWAGVENAVYLLSDCPQPVQDAFCLMEAQEEPILDAVCALAPPLVHFADNVSSDNMAGLYDEFMAAHHKRRLTSLHNASIKCAVHLDGVVRGILPKLAAAGFDAIEALTPQPAGDVPAQEMRGLAGSDSVVLWGGVPGALFAPPYTWEDMQQHVLSVLDAWAGTRFVLGVADQVPPDGDIDFCRKIAELVHHRPTG